MRSSRSRKSGLQQADAANERQDGERQGDRRAFEAFEFHAVGLNEKPEQLKAALVENKFHSAGAADAMVRNPKSEDSKNVVRS